MGWRAACTRRRCGPEPELAWPELKVAVLAERQLEDRPAFESAGWHFFVHPVDPKSLVATLAGEGGTLSSEDYQMTNPQVALSKDFMESYSRLPRRQLKKVREFTEKLQRDPTQSAINFERVELARDEKVRSVRIDQDYRAIVTHPTKDDVYLCVWVEWPDVIRETRLYIEKQSIASHYRAVLADEVQDFTANQLRLLRTIVPNGPNDLFLVGDAHQRIYVQPIRLSGCGIEIRGRSRRLKLNYRTTEQILDYAVAILEGREVDDLDGGLDSLKGFFSLRHGPKPEIIYYEKEAGEGELIVQTINNWLKEAPAASICLAARTRSKLRDRYEKLLNAASIDTVIVEKDPESEAKKGGIRLATMHRMKGLEFSRVLLAGVQEGTMPLELEGADEASREDHELQERCLLYVATTRARDELLITGYGKPSPFLFSIRGEKDTQR